MANHNVYDRLDEARSELAFLYAILPIAEEVTLSQKATFGLSLILERATNAMDAMLDQEQGGPRK